MSSASLTSDYTFSYSELVNDSFSDSCSDTDIYYETSDGSSDDEPPQRKQRMY